jgi:hypothetical protein
MTRDNDKSTSHHDDKSKPQRSAADQRGIDDGKGASGQPQKDRDAPSKNHQAAKPADGKSHGKSGSK